MWLASFANNWFIVLQWLAYNHISTVAKPTLEAGGVWTATLEFYFNRKLLCVFVDRQTDG